MSLLRLWLPNTSTSTFGKWSLPFAASLPLYYVVPPTAQIGGWLNLFQDLAFQGDGQLLTRLLFSDCQDFIFPPLMVMTHWEQALSRTLTICCSSGYHGRVICLQYILDTSCDWVFSQYDRNTPPSVVYWMLTPSTKSLLQDLVYKTVKQQGEDRTQPCRTVFTSNVSEVPPAVLTWHRVPVCSMISTN